MPRTFKQQNYFSRTFKVLNFGSQFRRSLRADLHGTTFSHATSLRQPHEHASACSKDVVG